VFADVDGKEIEILKRVNKKAEDILRAFVEKNGDFPHFRFEQA